MGILLKPVKNGIFSDLFVYWLLKKAIGPFRCQNKLSIIYKSEYVHKKLLSALLFD